MSYKKRKYSKQVLRPSRSTAESLDEESEECSRGRYSIERESARVKEDWEWQCVPETGMIKEDTTYKGFLFWCWLLLLYRRSALSEW